MFYAIWFVGVWVAIALTVMAVSKLEKSGWFDKYDRDQSKKD